MDDNNNNNMYNEFVDMMIDLHSQLESPERGDTQSTVHMIMIKRLEWISTALGALLQRLRDPEEGVEGGR